MPWEMVLLAYGPWIAAIGGGLYLGLRAVRALERRASSRKEVEAIEERTLRLEESLSEMAARLEQLRDGQEFTTRLLAERK